MNGTITLERVVSLYRQYVVDLTRVRALQRRLYYRHCYSRFEPFVAYRAVRAVLGQCGLWAQRPVRMDPQFDDLEAEMTYLLIRGCRPQTVVEVSPCGGWSTSWILHALKDNGVGVLYSYDLVDHASRFVPSALAHGRWVFIPGDVKERLETIPQQIDYLFIDSDHSAAFAEWYLQQLFPRLRKGNPVSVHDVFHTAEPSAYEGEGRVLIDWLAQRNLTYFTATPAKAKTAYDQIMAVKGQLHIAQPIHFHSQANPAIFFLYG